MSVWYEVAFQMVVKFRIHFKMVRNKFAIAANLF